MICGKILCVSKKFALLQTTAEMSAGSATLGCRGNDKKLPACARLPEFLQTCGGDEGGLSPLLSYRGVRSHRILRKGAQACGNELLWRRGI